MIGDYDLKVSKLYNMLPAEETETEGRTAATNATVRTVYIIGPDKKIKEMLIYPMSSGSNVAEILRLHDAIQLPQNQPVPKPVTWYQGVQDLRPPQLSADHEYGKMI